MGSNSSTRRVSFESDENDNVTVVKGIRLSENVINRMREPSSSTRQPFKVPTPPQSSQPFAPLSPPSRSESTVSPSQTAASPAVTLGKESVALPPSAVDEEKLRRKISEELHKGLEQEKKKAELEQRKRLEEEKAQVQAWAQTQVKQEVGRILEAERAAAQENIKRAMLKERVIAEDERLRAQLYELELKAKRLEERDQELRKQDSLYKEQVAKIEERSAQFYKVTTDNYQKAVNEVNSRFKRYEINPICAELQEEIVKCYRENPGKTLTCSSIASLYLQCVNGAKQNKLRTGG